MQPIDDKLTPDQLEFIIKRQERLFDEIRAIPKEGIVREHMGKELIVFPNVFRPGEDIFEIVNNWQVPSGSSVLDLCTGCGVLGVHAAYAGAASVVAIDINPDAVRTARENARRHNLEDMMEVRLSNMFEKVRPDEKFDIITANVPFIHKEATDLVAASCWDTDLQVHKALFQGANKHLNKGGNLYVAQGNFGAIDELLGNAQLHGFSHRLMGATRLKDPNFMVFYAYEFSKNSA